MSRLSLLGSRPRLSAIAVAIGLVLVSSGCGLFRGGKQQIATGARRDSVFVFAVNENYYEARIHAVYEGGQRHPLGTVAGNGGRARVALPWEPRAVEFSVFFVTAGTTYLSHPFDFAAGDSIELRVPLNISGSGFFRRVQRD